MPRNPRIIIPNYPHHITQRGNNKQIVFETNEDYRKYCYWIKQYSKIYSVDIYAYCLMPNHVHLILVPKTEEGIPRLFNVVNMIFSQYKNEKSKKVGHLWQGRYYSCVLSHDHLFNAIRYVENNPVRAKMVRRAWDYIWSSAREHVGISSDGIIALKEIDDFIKVESWREYLDLCDEKSLVDIRLRTKRGLAFGNEEFLKGLEDQFGLSFRKLRKCRSVK